MASRAANWAVGLAGIAAVALLAVWLWSNRAVPLVSPRCVATATQYTGMLDPEQAGNAALIAGTAVRRELPARAATIALATASQESGLRNIDHGDRDSLGLFQQRPSQGWGTAEQIMDPHYATAVFYDALVKADGYQTMSVTEAAQIVQRSGHPRAYADHEPQARAFAAAFYGQYPAALSCQLAQPAGLAEQSPDATGLTGRARTVIDTAAAELGAQGAALAQPPDDPAAGTWLQLASGGPGRAWGRAHWAVASADRLHIVDVRVADRRWTRADGEQWGMATTSTPPGVVWIKVA
ncbi:MAG: hypothetical protein CSA58_11070 [Micrococcales bacterium]|nr:MAG: hypothetical protein CSB46_00625 [Micrococcales bacterium]PIE26136.1 MAG: hypothetical protein CSA58_11070 [Micrococcales bacterium]